MTLFFGCRHASLSRPFQEMKVVVIQAGPHTTKVERVPHEDKEPYRLCLDCGRRFPFALNFGAGENLDASAVA